MMYDNPLSLCTRCIVMYDRGCPTVIHDNLMLPPHATGGIHLYLSYMRSSRCSLAPPVARPLLIVIYDNAAASVCSLAEDGIVIYDSQRYRLAPLVACGHI